MVGVSENTISVILKKNTLFVRFKKNFENLASQKLLPNIGNPTLKIGDFPLQQPGVVDEFIEFKLIYENNLNSGDNFQSFVSNVTDMVLGFIQQFTFRAIGIMMKSSEFIPLSGYSFTNLKKESIEALRNKRKFILIKDYNQYLDNTGPNRKTMYKFDIKVIDPAIDRVEYADVFCILQKDPEQAQRILQEKYTSQLKSDDWVCWC